MLVYLFFQCLPFLKIMLYNLYYVNSNHIKKKREVYRYTSCYSVRIVKELIYKTPQIDKIHVTKSTNNAKIAKAA